MRIAAIIVVAIGAKIFRKTAPPSGTVSAKAFVEACLRSAAKSGAVVVATILDWMSLRQIRMARIQLRM